MCGSGLHVVHSVFTALHEIKVHDGFARRQVAAHRVFPAGNFNTHVFIVDGGLKHFARVLESRALFGRTFGLNGFLVVVTFARSLAGSDRIVTGFDVGQGENQHFFVTAALRDKLNHNGTDDLGDGRPKGGGTKINIMRIFGERKGREYSG